MPSDTLEYPAQPSYLSILNRIPQRANLGTNINLDHIPRLQKLRLLHRIPNARTRTRHKHRPLLQRSPLRAIRHQRRNLEAQIINPRVLPQVAIDNSLEMQFRRVRNNPRRYELRAEWRVRVEAF